MLVAVLGVGAYLLTRDGAVGLPILGDDGPATPDLAFAKVKVTADPTTDTQGKDIDVTAVGDQVTDLVTSFYQGVWIDPDVWDGGDYADVFDEVMTGNAPAEAEANLEALTLGEAAGDTYEFVDPEKSSLTIFVLTDGRDEPVQVIAQVEFAALAEHTDGTFTDIEQSASYFLALDDDDWRIISFDATRRETEGEAPASPSASATTEAS
ncbi:MAG TPA: hypothetical protein VE032_09815 [Actinomycetota bacterium]|nr:hypothetical protein [Actinomycetota bacterium]